MLASSANFQRSRFTPDMQHKNQNRHLQYSTVSVCKTKKDRVLARYVNVVKTPSFRAKFPVNASATMVDAIRSAPSSYHKYA